MEQQPFATGARQSPKDSRTVKHENVTTLNTAPISGGVSYGPTEIDNQVHEGICTAISLTQNREKAKGRKYSADFQYLLQKKYYDLNWTEGSSILNALKVGKKYGFLPEELWTHTTLADRSLPYSQYIVKLQAVSDAEIQRLLNLCRDNILGYALVDNKDPQAIAKAIFESEAGILCRYSVGPEWWTSVLGVLSYLPIDINPLRAPQGTSTGHAINMSSYDYSEVLAQVLANTWSTTWNKQGNADVVYSVYRPTECWTILTIVPSLPPFQFRYDLYYNLQSPDVKMLQKFLNRDTRTQVATAGLGSPGNESDFFGSLTLAAVKKFQAIYGISTTGYCGQITRSRINLLLTT